MSEKEELEVQNQNLKLQLRQVRIRRLLALAILVALTVVVSTISAFVLIIEPDTLVGLAQKLPFVGTLLAYETKLPVIALVSALVLVVYSLLEKQKIAGLEQEISDIDAAELVIELRKPEDRLQLLQDRLFGIRQKAPSLFCDEPESERCEHVQNLTSEVGNELAEIQEKLQEGDCSAIQRTKLSKIHNQIMEIETIVRKEENEHRSHEAWRLASIIATLVYIVLAMIIAFQIIAVQGDQPASSDWLSVPHLVLVSSIGGGLTRVLFWYVFEKSETTVSTKDYQWMLTRPAIGIVMGVMTYAVLRAGIIILTDFKQPPTGSEFDALETVIPFLAAFSDTYYRKVIEVVEKVTLRDSLSLKGSNLNGRGHVP